ncbi:MAG: TonB-dependent receptor [Bacteroidetes bacterium]|nr:TonB-dependent receptor [Bacteroidota bacterium]
MKKNYYAFAALTFYLSSAVAQVSNIDSNRVYYSRPVVVTGTRAEMSERFVPASISVITSKELKSSGQISLLDALSRQVPGLFVAQRGVIGYGINSQAGTITIRGLGGSPNTQVLVMIDGVPQFMGLFGHPLPDSYLSEDAEKIEAIRGPAGVLYGTNAMGGVINIITKKNTNNGTTVRVGASYGSFNTQEYNAGAGFGTGKLNILLSGDHDQTDGHRPNSTFNTNDGYLNAGYDINDNLSIRLNESINKFKTYDPGTIYSPFTNNWVDVLRSTSSLSLNDNFTQLDGSLKLFYSYGDHTVYDGFHSLDRNLGAVLYQNFHPLRGSIFTVGADYQHYGGSAVNNIIEFNYGMHYVNEFGAYLLVEQMFFNQIMLNAGARLEHSSVCGDELVPQAGVAWAATSSTTIKASVSKGFRSPTIRELYLFPAPNPDLEPERLWNYEIGLMQSVTRYASFEFTGFLAEGSNLILIEGEYPNLQLLNSGSFTHRGIEFAGHYRPIGNLTVDASYSYTDPGKQTYSTPRQKMFVGIDYTYERGTVALSLEHIADLYGADNSQKRLPNYTVASAHVSYKTAEFVEVFVTGDNLFNVGYQTIYGYPMPGRTLYAGVNFKLERQ